MLSNTFKTRRNIGDQIPSRTAQHGNDINDQRHLFRGEKRGNIAVNNRESTAGHRKDLFRSGFSMVFKIISLTGIREILTIGKQEPINGKTSARMNAAPRCQGLYRTELLTPESQLGVIITAINLRTPIPNKQPPTPHETI